MCRQEKAAADADFFRKKQEKKKAEAGVKKHTTLVESAGAVSLRYLKSTENFHRELFQDVRCSDPVVSFLLFSYAANSNQGVVLMSEVFAVLPSSGSMSKLFHSQLHQCPDNRLQQPCKQGWMAVEDSAIIFRSVLVIGLQADMLQ